MLFPEEIINIILNYIYFKQYSKIDIIKLVSNVFYKSMYYIYEKYNIKEDILIATNIKHYRPEIEQIEYITNDFIIFDNFKYVDKWININNKKNPSSYRSYGALITKDILFITNNKLIPTKNIMKYNYVDKNIDYNLTNINKLNFKEYIIYYYYEDCIYCYAINFIILPYFDERILEKKTFLHYKKIKTNKFYKHDINKINGIYF